MKNLKSRRILFAVTVDYSINLLGAIPGALVDDGWDVHLVSNPGPELEQAAKQGHIVCHPIPMTRGPSITRDFLSFFRWLHLLMSVKPEVISIGTPKASLLGLLAGWVLRVPHRVYVLRGLRLETTTGLQLKVLSSLEKLTSACATHVVAVSPSLRRVYLEKNLTRPEKIVVLGYGSSKGVDAERFRPAGKKEKIGLQRLSEEIGLRSDTPVIGVIGRHGRDKGLQVLFNALALLYQQGLSYQVLAIGDDESNGGLARTLQLAEFHVVSIPRVHDVERYLRLIDVFCQPTLREGLPNVALEAQASGVPVITTNATGAIDSVENEVTGLVVRTGQASELAEALARVLSDPHYRATLGSNARPWAMNRFLSSKVISDNVEFYRKIFHNS